MILTCPNCNGQFNIDDALIGDKGRKVKCSSCAEVWFQEPEHAEIEEDEIEDVPVEEEVEDFEVDFVGLDESTEEAEEESLAEPEAEAEDIPPEDDISSDDQSDEMSLRNIKRAVESHAANDRGQGKSKPLGYGVAACAFFMILSYLLCTSSSMMQAHPSMQAFYGLFGIQMEIPGKGLVFDQLAVEDNDETITVNGRIINLEATSVNVPIIEASLMDAMGVSLTQWYIQPPANILEAESEMAFHSVYYKNAHQEGDSEESHEPEAKHETAHGENEHGEEAHEEDTQHVQIRFALLAKIDEADDESNSAHHQDAPDHQSDHEESSKSHQPASSASHQAPSPAIH